MSLTMQTYQVFSAFKGVVSSTLLRRLFLAHRLDLFLDFVLTTCSVVFDYASPFFLKRILDGLSDGSPKAISGAYVFAIYAFLSSCLKVCIPHTVCR